MLGNQATHFFTAWSTAHKQILPIPILFSDWARLRYHISGFYTFPPIHPPTHFPMVNLRSKLHFGRLGRKSSVSRESFPNPSTLRLQYHVFPFRLGPLLDTYPSRMEPIAAASVEVSTTHPTSSSRPPVATGPPALDTLPEEVLVKIVSFCNLGDVFRLRCSCKALSHVLDRPTVVEGIVRRIVSPSSFLPSLFAFQGPHNQSHASRIWGTSIRPRTNPAAPDPSPNTHSYFCTAGLNN